MGTKRFSHSLRDMPGSKSVRANDKGGVWNGTWGVSTFSFLKILLF